MTPANPDLQSARDAAVRILASLKATYSAPLEAVPVAEADFAHLDLPAYAAFRLWAEGEALRYLGDLEFPALSNSPTTVIARTMVRAHLSTDGTVSAEYYQVKPRVDRVLKKLLTGLMNLRWIAAPAWTLRALKTRHCVSFYNEFDDGSFVATSNAETAGRLSSPPSIDVKFFAYGTARSVLLEAHRQRVQAKLTAGSGCRASAAHDLTGVLARQRRLSQKKNAYRAAQDWISKAELNVMAKNRELADAVYAEIQKLLAEKSTGNSQLERLNE
jgi:hypothetical protein